jgi:hypothetical protein
MPKYFADSILSISLIPKRETTNRVQVVAVLKGIIGVLVTHSNVHALPFVPSETVLMVRRLRKQCSARIIS